MSFANNTFSVLKDPHYEKYSYVSDNYAQLSHFRKQLNFPYKTASISTLILDLNYFNCFFLPALNKLSKNYNLTFVSKNKNAVTSA
jgi:hypothetical protein